MQYKKKFETTVKKEQKDRATKDFKKQKSAEKKKSKEILYTGVFQSNLRGFGFVIVDGLDEDLYIPAGKTGNAFYGDTVEARLIRGEAPAASGGNGGHAGNSGKKSGSSRAGGHRTEAEIMHVVSHGVTKIVGTYEKEGGHGYIVPDNTKIPYSFDVKPEFTMNAVNGHKVVADIADYGSQAKNPQAKITEILGHIDDPGVDILSIIRANDLPQDFPDDVKEQVLTIPDHVSYRKRSKIDSLREDLRKTTMITVDGLDSKDLDDAVSLVKTSDNLWELGVHIADVSNYVTENSALDKEAKDRGTSIYLVDRVIPMLPHELSNGICSLNEGEDRYALSCIMDINDKGETVKYRIVESVINVNARMSYPGVDAILSDDDESEITEHLKMQHHGRSFIGIKAETENIAQMIRQMQELSKILSKRREKRGSIDFDTKESKIILDEKGHPVDIHPYERNESSMLIENFMLMANETVAQHCYWLDLPFVYRSHGEPDADKISQLADFLKRVGISLDNSDMAQAGGADRCSKRGKRSAHADASTDSASATNTTSKHDSEKPLLAIKGKNEIHPKEIQLMLEKIKGLPEEATLSRMTLRCMQQAQYTTDCEGHFGLALKYYCHFTSPIRRYPDLQIHRIIKEYLHGNQENQENQGKSGSTSKAVKHSDNSPSLSEDRIAHYNSILPYVAKHSSEMERRSDDAERQTDKQKKCEYMADRLGEEFEGVVSGVTGWGLYVELPNTCEGLIPMSCLFDDYYVFDEKSYILRGERKGGTYGLGQILKVKVAAVDIISRTIDFTLVDENKKPGNDNDKNNDDVNNSRHAGNDHKARRYGNNGHKNNSRKQNGGDASHLTKSNSRKQNGGDASHLTKSDSHKSMGKSANSEIDSGKRRDKKNGSRKKGTGKTGIKQQKSIS